MEVSEVERWHFYVLTITSYYTYPNINIKLGDVYKGPDGIIYTVDCGIKSRIFNNYQLKIVLNSTCPTRMSTWDVSDSIFLNEFKKIEI